MNLTRKEGSKGDLVDGVDRIGIYIVIGAEEQVSKACESGFVEDLEPLPPVKKRER